MANDDLGLIKDKLNRLENEFREFKSDMKSYKLIITTLICIIAVLVGKNGSNLNEILSQINS